MLKICWLGVLVALVPALAVAAPTQVTHQGRLFDASGAPLAGPADLAFRLYESAAGGDAIWTESYSAFPVDDGYFGIVLGGQVSLDDGLFSGRALYLGLSVNAGDELPRLPVVSVPYAIHATHANRADQASEATHAIRADSATTAESATSAEVAARADFADEAGSASTADFANAAGLATSADFAESARTAEHATTADTATTAGAVTGGRVEASEVLVGGSTVIAADGTIAWSRISGAPSGGVTLDSLGCAADQVAVFSGGSWVCRAHNAHEHSAAQITSGTFAAARLPIGTGSGQVAAGDHTHGASGVDASQVQLRVTGTCAVGSAIRAINQNGTVTCEVPAAPATGGAAQLHGPAQTFTANRWTRVSFSDAPLADGVRLVGDTLFFDKPGVYRITLSYRQGTGGDVWTATRLWGDSSTRGHSVGHGNLSASAELVTTTFLASVMNADVGYEIQVGRLASNSVVVTPNAIVGESAPAVQATVEHVARPGDGEAVFAQLEGPAQNLPANAWTNLTFDAAPVGRGVSLNGGELRFAKTGVYRVTLSYRQGAGANVATGVGLFQGSTPVGVSAEYGNISGSPELFTVSFLANVTSSTLPYELRFGRGNAGSSIIATTAIDGEVLPSIQATFQLESGFASSYAQAQGDAQTFAANNWTPVSFNSTPVRSGIQVSGANVTFPDAGRYQVSLTYRQGTGGDVWTAVRLFGAGTTRGLSTGFGNLLNSPEPVTAVFVADIADPSQPYELQVGRLTSASQVPAATGLWGVSLPAVQATFIRLD